MKWIQPVLSRPRLLALGTAVIAAIAAIVLAQAWSEQQRAYWQGLSQPKGGVQEVLVFSKDLVAGDVLSPQTVSVRVVQRALVPTGVFTPDQFSTLQGRRLAMRVQKGEVLLARQIAEPQSQDSISSARLGFRLIPVDRASAQMTWSAMTPKDRVDVWALGLNPEDMPQLSGGQDGIQRESLPPSAMGARPIATNLRVLSTNAPSDTHGPNRGQEAPPVSYFLEIPEAVVSSYLAAVAGGQIRYVMSVNGQSAKAPSAPKPSPVEILVHSEGSNR